MAGRGHAAGSLRDRLPPFALAALGVLFTAVLLAAVLFPERADSTPWAYVFALVPAVVLVVAGGALVVDPRPLALRRALAAAALAWLTILAAGALALAGQGTIDDTAVATAVLAGIDAAALLALAATTPAVAGEPLPDPIGRLGSVVVFGLALFVAAVVVTAAAGAAVAIGAAMASGGAGVRLRWTALVVVFVLPFLAFGIAAYGTHRAAGGTFYAQAAANRRNSLLLLVALVGVLAATAEIVAATVTFSSVPALWAAGLAAGAGLAAALGADRFGSRVILQTSGARPADPRRDAVLLDIVREVALAAGLPEPRAYVLRETGENAFAIGRDPSHASIVVTRGLVERLDREELQGVVAHEMGHVRNLDTRYSLYVAILVGLVALVTDGFLATVREGWRNGAFFWTGGDDSDARGAVASVATGVLVGLLLLVVASLLRLVAPLFAALVQAAVSREREFLADATAVELTRNPAGLERALADIAADSVELKAANRGTQHLWFRNPVKPGSDRRAGLFATHPSIGARVERLRKLRGVDASSALAPILAEET